MDILTWELILITLLLGHLCEMATDVWSIHPDDTVVMKDYCLQEVRVVLKILSKRLKLYRLAIVLVFHVFTCLLDQALYLRVAHFGKLSKLFLSFEVLSLFLDQFKSLMHAWVLLLLVSLIEAILQSFYYTICQTLRADILHLEDHVQVNSVDRVVKLVKVLLCAIERHQRVVVLVFLPQLEFIVRKLLKHTGYAINRLHYFLNEYLQNRVRAGEALAVLLAILLQIRVLFVKNQACSIPRLLIGIQTRRFLLVL